MKIFAIISATQAIIMCIAAAPITRHDPVALAQHDFLPSHISITARHESTDGNTPNARKDDSTPRNYRSSTKWLRFVCQPPPSFNGRPCWTIKRMSETLPDECLEPNGEMYKSAKDSNPEKARQTRRDSTIFCTGQSSAATRVTLRLRPRTAGSPACIHPN